MLAARGATRLQLVWMAMAEAVPLCVIAGIGGALAGLAGRTDSRPGNRHGRRGVVGAGRRGGRRCGHRLSPAALAPTPGDARIRRGARRLSPRSPRPEPTSPCWCSPSSRDGSSATIPPFPPGQRQYRHRSVLTLAPALALAGGTIAALRILPFAAGRRPAGPPGQAADRGPGQLAGQPSAVPPGRDRPADRARRRHQHAGPGPAQSWQRSNRDQAAFAAGADVRADLYQPFRSRRPAGPGPAVLGATPWWSRTPPPTRAPAGGARPRRGGEVALCARTSRRCLLRRCSEIEPGGIRRRRAPGAPRR